MTEAELAQRLQAEGLALKDGELPRVLTVANYLQGAMALIRAATPPPAP